MGWLRMKIPISKISTAGPVSGCGAESLAEVPFYGDTAPGRPVPLPSIIRRMMRFRQDCCFSGRDFFDFELNGRNSPANQWNSKASLRLFARQQSLYLFAFTLYPRPRPKGGVGRRLD